MVSGSFWCKECVSDLWFSLSFLALSKNDPPTKSFAQVLSGISYIHSHQFRIRFIKGDLVSLNTSQSEYENSIKDCENLTW